MSGKLVCPRCGTEFDVHQEEYAALAMQVRGKEFDKDVAEAVRIRMEAAEASGRAELERAVAREREAGMERAAALERQLAGAKAEAARLEGELGSARKLGEEAAARAAMDADLKAVKARQELEAAFAAERTDILSKFAAEKAELEAQVGYYRDMKIRMSTKMIGESLEEHCHREFDRIRAAAFPGAYFEKDNEVSQSGSKGDFVFRESRDGVELISIMFEMKNENSDSGSKKHKNEEFLKELDKDRREKGCEYAVLVTLLEPDNELYNDGIVDMSHRYPKMYVVRPQFFIPIITILRNAALNSLAVRRELAEAKAENADLAAFEARLEDAKEAVGRNGALATKQFEEAIEDIDKAIAQLQKTKEALQKSQRNLRIMGDKVDALSVRKLSGGRIPARRA